MEIVLDEYEEILKECLEKKGYELKERLGKGGFASCYKVRQIRLGYEFACKVIWGKCKPGDDQCQLVQESYYDEMNILKTVCHPNIIQIFDYFEVGPFKMIVVELCPNGDLEAKMPKQGFERAELINYANELIEAVKYLHSKSVSHHDIKPANCLIDPHGRLKLSDFGLAHHYMTPDSELKRGTLAYIAPEVITNSQYDPFKADVWSVGATLFKLACGKPSIGHASSLNEVKKLQALASTNVGTAGIRRDLAVLISRCLRYNPNDRPTIEEVAKDFEKIKKPLRRNVFAASSQSLLRQPNIVHHIIAQKREPCKNVPAIRPDDSHCHKNVLKPIPNRISYSNI